MSKLPELTLTKAGAAMLAKTPIGSEVPVTKWRIGEGTLPDGEDPRDRTQLVKPIRELPIASVENNGNQCLIKGQLVNTVMDEFTWRETGLYATDPDDGEILYAYGYEADGAEIPAGAAQLREIEFGVELVFDNAANVTAVISKTLVFATLDDLEQTKADAVEEALEQITTSPVAEELTDSDAFATVTAAGIKRTPLSLLKQVFGKLFAPNGFGLGTDSTIPASRSANNISQNGMFYCDADTPTASDWLVFHMQRDVRFAVQLAFTTNGSGYPAAKRIMDSNIAEKTWQPWEWIDPPLTLGTEYRTTERYNGKPVYAKLVRFGNLPNASSATVPHGIEGVQDIVCVSGSTSDRKNIPTQKYGAQDDTITLTVGDTLIDIYASKDHSTSTANILIRYTKITD